MIVAPALAALAFAQPWPILYASDRAPNLDLPVLRIAGAPARVLPLGTQAVSPDGRVAVVVAGRRLELVPVRGGGKPRVLGSFGPFVHVLWSPDSRRLAFDVVCSCGRADVWIAGRRVRRLVDHAALGAWSPDSRTLAVVRQRGRLPWDRRRWLWLVDAAGGRPRLLTRGEDPVWSPDGTRLAYYLDAWVHTVRADGRGAARVAIGDDAEWSPDGRRLAFEQGDWTDNPAFLVAQASGAHARVILHHGNWGMVGWAPSGSGIVVVSNDVLARTGARILLVSRRGRVRTLATTQPGAGVDDVGWTRGRLRYLDTLQLHAHEIWAQPLGGVPVQLTHDELDDREPARAPDGRIAYTRDVRGRTVVATMDADGSNQRDLVTPPAGESDSAPAWSPDGSWIVFTRYSSNPDADDLWLARPDGSDVHQLTHFGFAERPTWSPDGTQIAFDGGGQIDVVAVSGGAPRFLVMHSDAEDARPRWSPDGSWIAFDDGYATFVVHPDGSGRRRVGAGGRPTWSPDGSQLVVEVSPFAQSSFLRLLGVDGAVGPRVTQAPEDARDPAWAP